MDFISQIPLIGTFVTVVIPFLAVLGVVVFVHEYGHYIVGRWCGIHAEVFSIGFGKELYSWTDSRGTKWRLAALPLGGYVRFLGDADASSRVDSDLLDDLSESERARSFPGAALWRRAATVAAGPFANFLLTIVIFAGMAMALGLGSERPVIGEVFETEGYAMPLRPGDEVLSVNGVPTETFAAVVDAYSEPGKGSFTAEIRRDGRVMTLETGPLIPPVVGGVGSGAPADKAGLLPGDVILSANGVELGSFRDLQDAVRAGADAPVALRVDSGGEIRDLAITPLMNPAPDENGDIVMRPLIGVTAMTLAAPEIRTPGPIEAVGHGVKRTWTVITSSLSFMGAMIWGEADSSSLGGPIRIASMSGEAAEAGFASFLGMIALISTSIGLINLFPIPVLDGGHLLFYAIEALRGRPLGNRFVEAATGLGIGLVILLMVFVTYNDIASL